MASDTYARIYRVISKIPRGHVATYGQIAALADMPRAARQVGYALAALRDDARDVPWHRVINSKGEISARSEPGFEDLQRVLLEQEGVRFNAQGKVALEKVRWAPGVESSKRSKAKKPRAAKNARAAKTARGAKKVREAKAVRRRASAQSDITADRRPRLAGNQTRRPRSSAGWF